MNLLTYTKNKISDTRDRLKNAVKLYNRLPELEEFLLRIAPLVENIQIPFNETTYSITVALIPNRANAAFVISYKSNRITTVIRVKNSTLYRDEFLDGLPMYLWKYKDSIEVHKLEEVGKQILLYKKLSEILKPPPKTNHIAL